MSYKIVQPSTNSDRVGRFGVTSGTSDNVITFPNETGELTVTTDLPTGLPTTYVLKNTYTNGNNTSQQIIPEWDIPITIGKKYELEYLLTQEISTGGYSSNFSLYYLTSSLNTNTPNYGGNTFGYGYGDYLPMGIGYTSFDMTTEFSGLYNQTNPNVVSAKLAAVKLFVFLEATTTGTLRHALRDRNWTGTDSGSYIAGKSYVKITEIS